MRCNYENISANGVTIRKGDNVIFDDIYDCYSSIRNTDIISGRYDHSNQSSDDGDWCDTESLDDALNEFMYGSNRFNHVKQSISKELTIGCGNKNIKKLSPVGYAVNVPLYLQNIPNCMETRDVVKSHKLCTMVYQCNATCDVSSRELEEGGINFFKDVINKERNGIRTNVFVVTISRDASNYGYSTVLKLKDFNEKVNPSKIGFPLCSPSYFRRITFAEKERLSKNDCTHKGYGRSFYDKDVILKLINTVTCVKSGDCVIYNYKGVM